VSFLFLYNCTGRFYLPENNCLFSLNQLCSRDTLGKYGSATLTSPVIRTIQKTNSNNQFEFFCVCRYLYAVSNGIFSNEKDLNLYFSLTNASILAQKLLKNFSNWYCNWKLRMLYS